MHQDHRTRIFDKIRKNEEYAKKFHEVYRKTFASASWENTTWDYKQAVTAGVTAVIDMVEENYQKEGAGQ